jgi:hypothetical protein
MLASDVICSPPFAVKRDTICGNMRIEHKLDLSNLEGQSVNAEHDQLPYARKAVIV